MPAATTATLLVAAVLFNPAGADGDDRRDVRLQAVPAGELVVAAPTIDRLTDGDVLVVRVRDGVADAPGHVRQCRQTAGGFARCANAFPIHFDDEGDATFQYQVDDPGGCDGSGACVIVVDDDELDRSAHAFTVFGESAPAAPPVTLSPPGPYEPGDEVSVKVSSLRPGSDVLAAFCAPECRNVSTAVVGADGNAAATVEIGERCRDCGVVVVGGANSVRVDVQFTPAPSPGYDPARLIAGLAIAAMLLLVAWRIVVSVDWTPPSEAATPELDHEAW
jgi:hypothetical protein